MVEMFTQRFKFSILDIGQLFLRTQLSYTFFFVFGNFFLFLNSSANSIHVLKAMNAINLKFIVTRTINEPFVDIWALCNGRNNKKGKIASIQQTCTGTHTENGDFSFFFFESRCFIVYRGGDLVPTKDLTE